MIETREKIMLSTTPYVRIWPCLMAKKSQSEAPPLMNLRWWRNFRTDWQLRTIHCTGLPLLRQLALTLFPEVANTSQHLRPRTRRSLQLGLVPCGALKRNALRAPSPLRSKDTTRDTSGFEQMHAKTKFFLERVPHQTAHLRVSID